MGHKYTLIQPGLFFLALTFMARSTARAPHELVRGMRLHRCISIPLGPSGAPDRRGAPELISTQVLSTHSHAGRSAHDVAITVRSVNVDLTSPRSAGFSRSTSAAVNLRLVPASETYSCAAPIALTATVATGRGSGAGWARRGWARRREAVRGRGGGGVEPRTQDGDGPLDVKVDLLRAFAHAAGNRSGQLKHVGALLGAQL